MATRLSGIFQKMAWWCIDINVFSIDEIRRVNEYQVIPLHWRVSNSEDEVSKRIYFDAAAKINQNLTDEQISDLIFIVRDTQAGFEYIEQRNGYTVVCGGAKPWPDCNLNSALRTFLGYPQYCKTVSMEWRSATFSEPKHVCTEK